MDPRKLHQRILIALGVVAALLVLFVAANLATDHARGIADRIDRIALFLGALFVTGGYMLHAAVSSIFVGRATTVKGVVLAHVLSVLALGAWCGLLNR